MGSVDIRFDHGCGDRILKFHDVKFVDGQTKVLICLAIVAFCAELEISETQLEDPQLSDVPTVTSTMSQTTFSTASDPLLFSELSFQKKMIKQTFAPPLKFNLFLVLHLKTTF